jgi:hypothetical protein
MYIICWMINGILYVHNWDNILGMLLIILLSHVEIHICQRECFWILCVLALKAVTAQYTNLCFT